MKLRLILTMTLVLAFLTACGSDLTSETTPGPVVETVAPSITETGETPAYPLPVTGGEGNANTQPGDLGNTNANFNGNVNANGNFNDNTNTQAGGAANTNANANAAANAPTNTNANVNTNTNANTNANTNSNMNGSLATPAAPASGAATVTDEPMPADAVMRFQRSGGLTGADESWVLYEDGRLVDPQGNETPLGPTGVNTIMQAVDTAGFFTLDTQYGTGPSPDAFTYTITVQRNGQVHSVTTFDNATDAPPELTTLLNTIRTFLGI